MTIRNYAKEAEELVTRASWRVYESENKKHIDELRRRQGWRPPLKESELPPHGTKRRYRRGCKCEQCRATYAEYQREYRRKIREKNPLPERPPPKGRGREIKDHMHGTLTGYVYGCRCEKCTEEHKRRRPKQGIPAEHGSYLAYTRYECRCTRCTRGYREKKREYRRRYEEKRRARNQEEENKIS